jgi:hypothetical protein
MNTETRACWRNCTDKVDDEILAIDAMEDALGPLDKDTKRIRRLMTSFEGCHHKAQRWAELIVEAIGTGATAKGPGTRPHGKREPIESVWLRASAVLSLWAAGLPASAADIDVGGRKGSDLLVLLGPRTPLKEWQVLRIVDKLRAYIAYPLEGYIDGGVRYPGLTEHPECFTEHAEFREQTLRAQLRFPGPEGERSGSLALAIDVLQGCNWNFLTNLEIVLAAIGGRTVSDKPFAGHSSNIEFCPVRPRMQVLADTLGKFWGRAVQGQPDQSVLDRLGCPTPLKQWLTASFDKTLRLQFHL